jgi:uncharacterized integral membrane protein
MSLLLLCISFHDMLRPFHLVFQLFPVSLQEVAGWMCGMSSSGKCIITYSDDRFTTNFSYGYLLDYVPSALRDKIFKFYPKILKILCLFEAI